MKKTLSLIVLGCSSAVAMAQLDNTVEVTNEVNPVATDAKKVEVKAQAAETKVKHYTMQYAVEGQPLSNYAPESLGNYESESVSQGNRKGYVHLAGGVPGRLDGQLAYQFDLAEHDALMADVSLAGFDGKTLRNKQLGVSGWKSRYYRNRSLLKYSHRFDNGADLFVKGHYENHLYNYMGVPGAMDKQHDVLAGALVGFTPVRSGSFSIGAKAGVDFFSQNYRTTLVDKLGETLLHADAAASYEFGNGHSVGLGVEAFHSAYGNDELEGITRLRFTPHYVYSAEWAELQVGLFASTEGNVAPDVSFTCHVTPKSDVYVGVTGEEEDNTFRLFSATHPYFAVPRDAEGRRQKLEAAFYQVKASIGYRFRDFHGLGGNICAGYDQGKDVLSMEWLTFDGYGRQMLLAEFGDYRSFTVDADFSYAYEDIVKLEAKHQFHFEKWKGDGADRWVDGNYTTPLFSMDWKADVKLAKGFHLGLDWQYATFHQDDLGTEDEPQYKRPAMANLGASLRYTLPVGLPLTLFVKGDNLLNQNHDRYLGYRTTGASFLGGFALSF